MAKREKKSLASMIGQRDINPAEIEKAATELHNKPEIKEVIPIKKKEKEQLIRVSVDTPKGLYMKMKAAAFEEDIKSLRHFYLHCAKVYLENKGKL